MDKILVVDSSRLNTELISQCLEKDGYLIYSAETGQNALAKVSLFKPDLIILSENLPDISGYDVCKRIKLSRDAGNTMVLFLLDEITREARIRAIHIEADDVMEKSFDSLTLKSKINSLLRAKHLSDQVKQKYLELEEKNKILEFQLKMARQVQRTLIQEIDYSFNGISFNSTYLPALDVGGDFYNLSAINDDWITLVMGDVSGHGVSAALLTTMLNTMFNNLVFTHYSPDSFLYNMNNQFCSIFEKSDSEMFACLFFALIDTKSRKIYYANAGQALPIFVNSKEDRAFELEASGIPIGMMKDTRYEVKVQPYNKGDLLFIHTDGLSDVFYKENPEEFSAKLKASLVDSLKSSNQEIIDSVVSEFYALNLTEAKKYELDDVSIMVCKF